MGGMVQYFVTKILYCNITRQLVQRNLMIIDAYDFISMSLEYDRLMNLYNGIKGECKDKGLGEAAYRQLEPQIRAVKKRIR